MNTGNQMPEIPVSVLHTLILGKRNPLDVAREYGCTGEQLSVAKQRYLADLEAGAAQVLGPRLRSFMGNKSKVKSAISPNTPQYRTAEHLIEVQTWLGLKSKEFAAILGTTPKILDNWKTGKSEPPEILWRLLYALETTDALEHLRQMKGDSR